ncbi:ABC transporter substrate-binding protein [Halarcobacter ebronensis]|uniref:histidine kinase n=1 Tax=Halarcobacter ebronensis TaxID=1462615 RepID=A0A4Q1AM97_9BACT|nr:ABC transporter substrate-binding protein [Halarcobacter ebronensis]QKF82782.1 BvgS-like domain-containing signal transduction sensor histidine kinase (NMT1 domain) [Halarcobacter ebronensis]RXK06806.1 histidine kinase [Halarcobacter ebronensis]
MLLRVFFVLLLSLSTLFSKDLRRVSLQLSWFDQFQFAGYYIAKEKGFYKNYGLDVDIKPFKFGINVVDDVNSKKADFSIARETLILDRVEGKNVVALYALFQNSPLILLSLKNSGINNIEDFKNKRIMTTIDDASEVSIKAMLLSRNLDFSKLDFIKHSHNIMDLVNNKTDVISAYISKTPYDLKKIGVDFNIFAPKDYGFDMYSDFLITNDDFVKSDIYSVRAFKEASLKGWEYAFSHIEESAKLIYEKYNTQNLSLEALIYEGEKLKELAYHGNNKLGDIKLDKIQRIYDLYNVMGLVSHKIDPHKLYLNGDGSSQIYLNRKESNFVNKNQKIKMCIIPNIKPYSFVDDGTFSGIVADYMNLVAKKSSLKFELINTMTFKDSLEYLKEGKCDILSAAENIKSREEFFNFTKPYINVSLVLITKNSGSFIDDLSILKDKKIGIYKHYSFNKKLRENYPENGFVDVDSIDDAINRINRDEIYGYVDLILSSWNKIVEKEFGNLKISAKLNLNTPLSIAVKKEEPTLYAILEKAVGSISKKEREEIFRKWQNVEYKKEFDYDLLWKFLIIFVLIVSVIVYKQRLLKNMNDTLKEKVEEKTKELKQINQELEQRVKKEVEANLKKDSILSRQAKFAAMGEMIQNIAHQWRQPLSIISTGASGLKLEKELNGDIDDKLFDDTLSRIIDTTSHLSNTIDDFMYFFKPNKNKSKFKIEETIDKTLSLFNDHLNKRKINIIKDINSVTIKGYESELIQILINIINNSKDAFAQEKTEGEMYIFISAKNLEKAILIEVRDNAGGIKEEIIDKIFEPYFTTKHQYHGTGIGLYMCKQIIDKHMHGSIEGKNITYKYNNKVYKGASFIIYLEKEQNIEKK